MLREWAFALPSDLNEENRAHALGARLVGLDGVGWHTETEIADGILWARRDIRESPSLLVSWSVPGFPTLELQTNSLMNREQPYDLEIELARGELGRLRDRLADFQASGFSPSHALGSLVDQAISKLAEAALSAAGRSASLRHEKALASLRLTLQAGEQLVSEWSRQAIGSRRKHGELKSRLGTTFDDHFPKLPDPAALRRVFDHVAIPVRWPHIEPESGHRCWDGLDQAVTWCLDHGLAVTLGPLVDFRPGGLPSWLARFDDLDLVTTLMIDFVESCVHRFQDRVRHWEVTGGANIPSHWSEQWLEHISRLLMSAIRHQDETAKIGISVAQPWGDYLSRNVNDRSPIDFVDRMLRTDVSLAFLVLEVANDYEHGSKRRPVLRFLHMIDRFAHFGVPIRIRLFYPTRGNEDRQADWLEQHVMPSLAKTSVELVEWGTLHDSPPTAENRWPDSGLFDVGQHPKRALRRLRAIRRGCFH